MEIAKIAALGIVATVLIIIIKQQRPELAMQLSLLVGVTIFGLLVGKIHSIVTLMQEIGRKANTSPFYLSTILKIVGIAYVAEFSSQICRDAGESAIGSKIEFAAKVIVIVLAIPIIASVFEFLLNLLP